MPTPFSALVATGVLLVAGMASAESIGQFAANQGMGAVSYDNKRQQYRIIASGMNTWSSDDQMHYAHNRMHGDLIVTARVAFDFSG